MHISQFIGAVGYRIGNLLAPLRCACCDTPLDQRALLCQACAATVIRWDGDHNPMALGLYGGALASTVLRLKYGKRPDIGTALGELLCSVVLSNITEPRIDVVVPVPTPYSRLSERGYNQAALIAKPVASALSARFEPRALARRDGSIKQAALGRNDRLTNLHGAFSLRDRRSIADRRVLLVDDVSTTGATLNSCRKVLSDGGARCVHAVVVARTDNT